jgi:hypothetical protein
MSIFIKSSYFYIVSRQEETRFQLVSKTPQIFEITKINTTRITRKIQDFYLIPHKLKFKLLNFKKKDDNNALLIFSNSNYK